MCGGILLPESGEPAQLHGWQLLSCGNLEWFDEVRCGIVLSGPVAAAQLRGGELLPSGIYGCDGLRGWQLLSGGILE